MHAWNLTPAEAVDLQNRLAKQVCAYGDVKSVRWVAGADISVPRGSNMGIAALVVLSYPSLELVEVQVETASLSFPYIPGFLSFREAPLIINLFEKLRHRPDLLLVDGHGIAHPRRFGIASHLGLWLDVPTIGCAKSRLFGKHAELNIEAGSVAYLYDNGVIIGTALRTRRGSSPLYVSSGHNISLENALQWVLSCTRGYRLPEPTRLAHLVAGCKLPVTYVA